MDKRTEHKDPLFNSGIAYLERLHEVKKEFHKSLYNNNLEGAQTLLETLQSELYWFMNKQEKERSQILETKADSILKASFQGKQFKGLLTSRNYKKVLIQWFRHICKCSQRSGLEMPDKPSELEATEV